MRKEVKEIAKSNVVVSDLTGAVLNAGNHIKVVLKEAEGDATYILDAAREEVAELIAKAAKQKRRGRKPKTASAASAVAEPVSEPEPELAVA